MASIREVSKRYHSIALKNKALGRGWIKDNADIGEMNRISMIAENVLISRYGGYNGVMNPNRGFGCVCSVFEYVKNARTYGDKFIDARVDTDVNMGIEKITIETEKFIFRIFYNGNPDSDFHTIEINRKPDTYGIRAVTRSTGGGVYAPRRLM